MNRFIEMCCMTQEQLKDELVVMLINNGYKTIVGDGYVYAKGDMNVLLTAHMDTVHKELPQKIEIGDGVLSSPQGIGGDDRCGCYMIERIVETGRRPSILFCEDEEIGGVGSGKFTNTEYIDDLKELNFLVELDRMNGNDAVFYDCGNEEFQKWVCKTTGCVKAYGSFSDISHLSPACGIASVNLSCGYYKAHTTDEYVVWDEMEKMIENVCKLLDEDCEAQWDYMENEFDYSYLRSYCSSAEYGGLIEMLVTYMQDGELKTDVTYGYTEDEALLQFFVNNPTVCFNDIQDYYSSDEWGGWM